MASGCPCLSRFEVKKPGLCLTYFAEDSLQSIGGRFRNICYAKKIAPEKVPVFFIDSPVLRLDDEEHRTKIEATFAKKSPTLLILNHFDYTLRTKIVPGRCLYCFLSCVSYREAMDYQ